MNVLTAGQLFPVGPPVPPELQIGRDNEIAILCERLSGGIHCRLSDERRVGKTTVALSVLERLRSQEHLVHAVDLSGGIGDCRQLADRLASQLAANRSASHAAAATGRHFVFSMWERSKGVGRVNEDLGNWRAVVETLIASGASSREVLAKVFDHIDEVATEIDCRAIVFLDELQEVDDWEDGDVAQKALHTAMTRERGRTAFLIAGSRPSLLAKILKRGHPLAFDGMRLGLAKIEIGPWREGLQARFAQGGIPIESEVVDVLIDEAERHPLKVMAVAFHSFETAQRLGTQVDRVVLERGLDAARQEDYWKELG